MDCIIDKLINELRLLELDRHNGGGDNFAFDKIVGEGRYLKTLLQCAGKLSNRSSISKAESYFHGEADHLLTSLLHALLMKVRIDNADKECLKLKASILFKGAIWGLYSSMFDSISNILVHYYHRDDDGLNKLKVELKLLKIFFMCALRQEDLISYVHSERGLAPLHKNRVLAQLYESREQFFRPGLRQKFLIYYPRLERDFAPLHENGKQFFSPMLRWENGLQYHDLAEGVSIFREHLQGFKHLICEHYTIMPHSYLQWIPFEKKFKPFFYSFFEILEDIIIWGEASDTTTFKTLIEPLKKKLQFFRSFIFLFTLTGMEPADRLIYLQVAAVDAAHLCCMCWFYRDDDRVLDRISSLVQKIKSGNKKFRDQYYNFLRYPRYEKLSFTQLIEPDLYIVADFVDSLLCVLGNILNSKTSIMVYVEFEIGMLAQGLIFLRTMLKKQQEKLTGLSGEMKNLIKDVVCYAGHVISSLDQPLTEVDIERISPQLACLQGNIDLIKAEFEGKYPSMPTFNFPTANELGFIDLILKKLKELASCKVDSIPFENVPIQMVKADLLSLRSFLENIQERRSHHDELRALWTRVIEVAYKTEFAIDSLIAWDISPYSLKLFDISAKEIALVTNETLKIDDKKIVYFQAQKAAKSSSHVPSQGIISLIKDIVVGFDVEAKEIKDQLIGGFKRLEIVSIVGMPGLGKTTLAKKVYLDSSVIPHFHICAWCSVSQVWCRKDLLLEILHCIVPDHFNEDSKENEDDLAGKLRQRLKGKRYLIVLDDVWDIEAWDALRISFPDDASGSRILLTGRNNLFIEPNVKTYPLRRRTDDECWELLQKKQVYKVDFSPSLCDIGRRIAKNCNGLPLSVVIIAGILVNVEQDGWEEVATSSNISCGTEECMSILELSYRHLPDYLKPCLLYFGAFPEDQEIPIDKLMWLWIAEGFLQKNELKSLEDTAEDCIMALISRNLVMVAKEGSLGRIKTCRIHDLLHEFCKVKSKEQNFLHLMRDNDDLCNFDEPHKLRRLCMHSQAMYFEKWKLFYCQIRSVLLFSCGAGNHITLYNLPFLFRCKLLTVLDLGQINLGLSFPSEITMLVQLRYLEVLGRMKDVPTSIANLLNLETFLVTINLSAWKGFSLPNTLWNMQKLRHIHAHGCLVDLSVCADNLEDSSNLENLDTFSTPKLYLGQSMEKITRQFPNIRKLKCSLAESEESNVDSNKIVIINFPSRLESLKLLLGNVDVLHVEFNFPSNLKKLTLANFSWSMISTIRKLPNLEVLKLLKGVVNEVGTWKMEEEEFPILKILKLEYSDIVSWTSSSDDHFPCLQKLVLEGCRKLEMLPSCLEDISTLDLIKVHRCSDYVGELVREIGNVHKSWGNEGLKILITEEVEKDLYCDED